MKKFNPNVTHYFTCTALQRSSFSDFLYFSFVSSQVCARSSRYRCCSSMAPMPLQSVTFHSIVCYVHSCSFLFSISTLVVMKVVIDFDTFVIKSEIMSPV